MVFMTVLSIIILITIIQQVFFYSMKWHYSFTKKFTILNHNRLLKNLKKELIKYPVNRLENKNSNQRIFFNLRFLINLTLYNSYKYLPSYLYMTNYLERLKNKIRIKKIESDQPIGAWIFVLLLNIVGFAGYFYLKINNIQLGS